MTRGIRFAMATIDLLGHRTWAKLPKGRGATVLLLHGGMSSSASMLRSIGPGLSKSYKVSAFDRRGHGRTADTDEPFHYDDMANETIAFITSLGRRVHLVGHSDGGVIALLVALRRPELLKRVVVIGANYHHDGLMDLDVFEPESPDFDLWAQKYAQRSPDGVAHARVVFEKTMRMTLNEPSLSVEDRETHEEELLDFYLDQLRVFGVEIPPDVARAEFARYTLQPVVMLVCAAVLVERTERGDRMFLSMIDRGIRAARKWDAMGELGRHAAT